MPPCAGSIRSEDALEDGANLPCIRLRVETHINGRGRKMACDKRVLLDDIPKRGRPLPGLHGKALDGFISHDSRGPTADELQHNALRRNDPSGEIQVPAHLYRIHN